MEIKIRNFEHELATPSGQACMYEYFCDKA